jgi:predicted DNA binding CopG/RHH family protein
MPGSRKKIPKFSNEDGERDFWAREDSTDYIDWSDGRRVPLEKLKPTLRTISIRLPESMLGELRVLANKRGVGYQALLKMFLADRIRTELSEGSGKR